MTAVKAYVMDAFSRRIFGGNQAGVVLPERMPDEALCRQIAAEFKHSETAFVTCGADGSVTLRYFTPAEEVELCGHATVAAFSLLRKLGRIGDGAVTARTKAGDLQVEVSGGTVWMDMAPPKLLRTFTDAELPALYGACGLTPDDCTAGLAPEIVSTGLADILLPVRDHDTLLRAVQDTAAVAALSRRYDCVGVHMFCPGEGCTAYCSNFAPLYGIAEECATGTANGALTWYLYRRGLVRPGEENVFVQGEHMDRPSEIRSRLYEAASGASVRIGGEAVMSMACEIQI